MVALVATTQHTRLRCMSTTRSSASFSRLSSGASESLPKAKCVISSPHSSLCHVGRTVAVQLPLCVMDEQLCLGAYFCVSSGPVPVQFQFQFQSTWVSFLSASLRSPQRCLKLYSFV